jgi:hypothetical protein
MAVSNQRRYDSLLVEVVMRNELTNWYVASVGAPRPRLGGALEVYRGWTPCIEWCKQTFGEITIDNFRWRFISEGVFEFRYEPDRTAFLLRWA